MPLRTSVMLATLPLVCALGCPSPEHPTSWNAGDESCAITICLNGAGGPNHPGNIAMDAICADLPGLIEDCAGEECRPSFRFSAIDPAVGALGAAMREARAIFGDDEFAHCPVSLLGYSFGAVNAIHVAEGVGALGDDERKPIQRMVMVDAFAPLAANPLPTPDSVEQIWSYRHSIAPEDDCSHRPLIGPYEGIAPACELGGRCLDYDFSLTDEADVIDHCNIVERVAPAVIVNVVTGEDADEQAFALPPPTAL